MTHIHPQRAENILYVMRSYAADVRGIEQACRVQMLCTASLCKGHENIPGWHAGGSGSGYITGFCDKIWRPGMTAEQCEDFVRRAVGHALARDGSSGGCIRTVTITKAGIKRTFTPNDKVQSFFNPYRPSGPL